MVTFSNINKLIIFLNYVFRLIYIHILKEFYGLEKLFPIILHNHHEQKCWKVYPTH